MSERSGAGLWAVAGWAKRKVCALSYPVPVLAKALVVAVWNAVDDRNLSLIAAGVAFYSLLAIFPGMATVIALWGYFSDPAIIIGYLEIAKEFIPAEAFALLDAQLTALVAANTSALGWTSLISLAVALYSAKAGVGALIQGLNAIHARPNRGGLRRLLLAWALTLSLIGLVLIALCIVIFVPLALALLPISPTTSYLVSRLPWLVMFLLVLVTLGMFYRYGPNSESRADAWVTPGAAIAALLWASASVAFSIYLANFGVYNRIYGSIGAVVALLMWFYISAYTILLGAAVNAELGGILGDDQ